jgi:pimeloyl-ACP methyl ester carboxylesterase
MGGRIDLLLLPGMLCDAAFWQAQADGLADICATVVMDYGAADSIAAMADAVLAHAPASFVLAGHSMGGRVALEVCRRAPERVAKLGLFATDYRGPADEASRRGEAERAERMLSAFARDGVAAWARAFAREMVAPERHDDEDLIAAVAAMFARNAPARLAAHSRAGLTRPDYSDLLPLIACPVLVCAGTEDRLRTVDLHRAMAESIRDARLMVFSGCGHMLAMECPEAVTAAMRDWLSV